jgi:hypothetical protein
MKVDIPFVGTVNLWLMAAAIVVGYSAGLALAIKGWI